MSEPKTAAQHNAALTGSVEPFSRSVQKRIEHQTGQKLYTQSDLDTLLAKMDCGHLRAEWVAMHIAVLDIGTPMEKLKAIEDAQQALKDNPGHCAACLREQRLVQVVVERAAQHRFQKFSDTQDRDLHKFTCECGVAFSPENPAQEWEDHIRQLSSPENVAGMIKEAQNKK